MNLREADVGIEYVIDSVETDDAELDSFLFSLGFRDTFCFLLTQAICLQCPLLYIPYMLVFLGCRPRSLTSYCTCFPWLITSISVL